MFAHNSRLFTPFAASHCRSVSFTIKNIFKIKLAETEMSPEAAARQAEIDDGVRQLLRTAKPVHRDNVLASALASPMRQCVIHKYALPSAFLLRFICAYNGNQATIIFDPTGSAPGRSIWLSACGRTLSSIFPQTRTGRPAHNDGRISVFTRILKKIQPICRTDMAAHVLVQLRRHCLGVLAKAIASRRAVCGSVAIRAHARTLSEGYAKDGMRPDASLPSPYFAMILPFPAMTRDAALQLAKDVQGYQMMSHVGTVAVAPHVPLEWRNVVEEFEKRFGMDTPLPVDVDCIAITAGKFCSHVFVSVLRLSGVATRE